MPNYPNSRPAFVIFDEGTPNERGIPIDDVIADPHMREAYRRQLLDEALALQTDAAEKLREAMALAQTS